MFGYEAPYKIEKFHPVLKASKLQAPSSRFDPRWGTRYGQFRGIAHKYFYLEKKELMSFAMCGKKHRSELRQRDDFKVEDTKPHTLYAEVKLYPKTTQREFTFLQIHADPTLNIPNNTSINKPLLRVVWKKRYRNRYNHLWAVICTNTDVNNSTYTKIDLGRLEDRYHSFKIVVQNSRMKIYVDGDLKVDFDVSYWNGMWNYYKAGVYLQSNGCAKATFKELRFE